MVPMKSTRKKSSATGKEVRMVALAQQLRHFHEAVRARSHVRERSALVQMMQEDAALLADLSIVLVGSDQRYRTLLTAWEGAPTERHRYAAVFEAALTALIVTDQWGHIHEANPAAAALLDMPLMWLMRKPLVVFVSQDERYTFRVFVHALGQGAYLPEWEGHVQPRRGSPVAVGLVACRVFPAHAVQQRLLWRVRVMASPPDRADIGILPTGRHGR
jgi:PAS domain-containing protein